jgi:hypothetical protein
VAEEEDRFYMQRFAGNSIPLAGDLGKDDTSFKALPKEYDNDASGGLLNEVLG